jgi:hypothetical protein
VNHLIGANFPLPTDPSFPAFNQSKAACLVGTIPEKIAATEPTLGQTAQPARLVRPETSKNRLFSTGLGKICPCQKSDLL